MQEIARRTEPADSKLRLVVERHVTMLLANRDAGRIFFEDRYDLPDEAAEEILGIGRALRGIFVQIIRQGVEEGVFDTVEPDRAALYVLGMCNWTYRWYRESGPLSAQQVADEVARLCLRALGAPSR
ncbi:MAG: hypothetical protein QJR14_06415 [Bacillota bacterium]|nr:hypothetical protein [Bacillota bacterium]